MCTKWEVHIFNVWTITTQSVKIKKMKTVGVTDNTNQTTSKHFWMEKWLSSTPLRIKKLFMNCARNRRCTSSICYQSICKVWIKSNENCWSHRLRKLGTPKVLQTDRRTDKWTNRRGSGPITRATFARATQVKIILKKHFESRAVFADHTATAENTTCRTASIRPITYNPSRKYIYTVSQNTVIIYSCIKFRRISWAWNCNVNKKGGKDQESIQSSTTPDSGYQCESDNVTVRHHKREPRGKPFTIRWPQGINKHTCMKA